MADTDLSSPSSTDEAHLVDLEQSDDRWEPEVDKQITDLRARLYPGEQSRNRVVDQPDAEAVPDTGEDTDPDRFVPGPIEADRVEVIFEALEEFDVDMADDLRATWGGNAGIELAHLKLFVDKYPGIAELAERRGLGTDPAIFELGARLGRELARADPSQPGRSRSPAPARSAQAELEELEGSPNRWDKRVDQRITQLRQKLFPGDFHRNPGSGAPR